MDEFIIEESFPTLITPKNQNLDFHNLAQLLAQHKNSLEKLLLRKGALLFRDFPIKTPDDFSSFIENLKIGRFVNYIAGDSPRSKVKNKVYTSTETPPDMHLPLHQELSYIKNFPHHIYFFCETPPTIQGETILGDARQIYRDLDIDVVNRFQEKGITYISHYHKQDKIMNLINRFKPSHKTWPEVFETTNKNEIEKICHENEIEICWLKNEWLEMKQHRPVTLTHPITHETVWFNQAHLYDFNPRLTGGFMRYIGAKLLYLRPGTQLHKITFIDGSPISRKDIYHILDVLEKNTVAYPWKKGDIMVLDNILTMHGRAPFKGSRRILTALTLSERISHFSKIHVE